LVIFGYGNFPVSFFLFVTFILASVFVLLLRRDRRQRFICFAPPRAFFWFYRCFFYTLIQREPFFNLTFLLLFLIFWPHAFTLTFVCAALTHTQGCSRHSGKQ